MDDSHIPVLLESVMAVLAPQPGDVVVDATIGRAGHASRMLRAIGGSGLLIGLDVDLGNLAAAKANLADLNEPANLNLNLKFRLFHANFAQLDEVLDEVGIDKVNVILADLGVASSQLDDPARGLSFQAQADGPLDMRLDPRLERTAADIVNNASQTELADLLFQLGGEVLSRKIAREICRRRVDARIATTRQLVGIIGAALHVNPESRKSKIHPATRTFQALRIAVNHELESLDRLLELAGASLAAGGRLGVISFHSLEDRRVKQSFQAGSAQGAYQILTRKPIQASEQEAADNPRSRSAKFRAVRKIG